MRILRMGAEVETAKAERQQKDHDRAIPISSHEKSAVGAAPKGKEKGYYGEYTMKGCDDQWISSGGTF